MMNRVEIARTKIRPLKKLFIIEEGDLPLLVEIVKFVSEEIVGLSNLIFVNDQKLYSDNIVKFIDRHNPDVIINCSSASNDKLTQKYKIPSFTVKSLKGSITGHFSTPLSIIDNLPYPMTLEKGKKKPQLYASFENTLDALHLMYTLNFGGVPDEHKEFFISSVFEKVKISPIRSLEQFFDLVGESEKNFLYMSLDLANIGEGSSVWHLDYNPERLFKDKPTIVFGGHTDINSMVYFWNMRATYPYNKTVWLPVELFDDMEKYLQNFNYCCVLSRRELIESKLEKMHLTELDGSQYYFNMFNQEWNTFEHLQNVAILNESVKISHPVEKLFSRMGLNINFILEISGLKELHLPKSLKLGELFVSLPDKELFSNYFARINKLSLSIYRSDLSPLEANTLIETLSLPNDETIFSTLFREHRLNIKPTPGTQIANQAINLVGGYEGIELLSNKLIFELLVKLTPPRTEKLVKSLIKKLDKPDETEIREIITKNLLSFTTINSNVIVDIDKISSLLSIQKTQAASVYPLIQKLYERKILLRGKSFPCPQCGNLLWYPLEAIGEENKCYGCNQLVSIPIFSGSRILGDNYRLNELIANAVDQGVLPLLLTIYFISKQKFYMKRFIPNYKIYSISDDQALLAEIDLIFTLGAKLGLAEIKADRGFENDQVDKLLNIANLVDADMVVFSTLRETNSEEVRDLVNYLNICNLKIPAFIFTKEVLFEKKLTDLSSYFEVDRISNIFPCGPIVLQRNVGSR